MISITINGATYELNPYDTEAISQIPGADRQQLMALLETIKQQDADAATCTDKTLYQPSLGNTQNQQVGTTDPDALMARLIMEERASQPPTPAKSSLYKFIIGATVVTILLILAF